jgi:OOP family OmpA-OmpF porin
MLAPVIMPVIAQAVAKATKEAKQSIEDVTSSMFTIQGLKWRMEASRTGKPYSEIAFKNKYNFVVEHLVLSAKRNGDVLSQSVKQSYIDANDSQFRFVIDNHLQETAKKVTITDDSTALDNKAFDTFNTYTVHGVWCALSAVVTGVATEEFLKTLLKQLKSIEMDFNDDLKSYRQDALAFTPLNKNLGQLLDFIPSETQDNGKDAKVKGFSIMSALMWLALIALVAYIGFLAYSYYEKTKIVHALSQQKGFVQLGIEGNAYSGWNVKGMQDPHVFDSKKLELDDTVSSKIRFNAIPFISLTKQSVLARLNKKISKPAGVEYSFDESAPRILVVTGLADEAWIAQIQTIATTVEGIDATDIKGVKSKVNEQLLFDTSKQSLEKLTFVYINKASEFSPGQDIALEQALSAMRTMIDSSTKNGFQVSFLVSSHLSGKSSRTDNATLLFDRFITIKQHFGNQGIDPNLFQYAEQIERPLDLAAATISVIQGQAK